MSTTLLVRIEVVVSSCLRAHARIENRQVRGVVDDTGLLIEEAGVFGLLGHPFRWGNGGEIGSRTRAALDCLGHAGEINRHSERLLLRTLAAALMETHAAEGIETTASKEGSVV
jgi:hypothetical protein